MGVLAAAAALPFAAGAPAEPGGLAMGGFTGPQLTLLAIDNQSLPLRGNLCYYLNHPTVVPEPVLQPSRDNPHATDTVATHFYGTVLHDNGKFRMWYYGASWKEAPTNGDIETTKLREGPVCYAESDDGLHWTKPNLGQVSCHGGSDNNAIALPDTQIEGTFVIKDETDPDPARRYKMVYENHPANHRFMSVRTATSPDGIHWSAGPDSPIDEGLEPCSFYQYRGLYCIGAHFAPAGVSEGGNLAGRQGFVWVSTDFRHWLPESAEAFLLPEPEDPNDRGLDRPGVQVHLGVGAFPEGNVVVGIYCRWDSRPKVGDWFGRGTTKGDFGLLVSNDGLHFREPVKDFVFLDHRDSNAVVTPGIRHQVVLEQSGNGILNVGDETWIYHGRWVNPEKLENYTAEIALAKLPRDRWGALGLYPRADEGAVWSAPLEIDGTGARVLLNADGAQGMSVDVADESFHPLADFSGEHAGATTAAGGLDCPVTWSGHRLDELAGRKIRLRVRLKRGDHPDPRLFAVYVRQS